MGGEEKRVEMDIEERMRGEWRWWRREESGDGYRRVEERRYKSGDGYRREEKRG